MIAATERRVRVWLYRGWCWACHRCSLPYSVLPGAVGWGFPSPGQAADAGRLHRRTECTPRPVRRGSWYDVPGK